MGYAHIFVSGAPTRPSSQRKRVLLYDILRVFAILCVVLCHCAELAYTSRNSWSYSLLHFVGRLGVPVFLFLTGALVMSKEFDSSEMVGRFYRHNLLGLLMTIEIWVVLYCLWMSWYGGAEISVGLYLKYALFFEAVPFAHWWYIPTIMSIYVVVPLVASGIAALSGDDDKVHLAIKLVLGFSLFVNFVIPSYNRFTFLGGLPSVGTQLVGSVFGPYITYIVTGLLILRREVLQGVPTKMLAALFILTSTCAAIEGHLTGDLWYDSIFLLSAAAALVELSRRLIAAPSTHLSALMGLLSKCSFGVFLVHMPVRDSVSRLFTVSPGFGNTVLLYLATAVLSFAIVMLVWFATARVAWLRRALLDA